MTNQIVLLTDNMIFGEYGTSRYIGPYVLATQLREAGFETAIIDYFTSIEDFFNYLEPFLSRDTLVVGISSTFLFPQTPEFGNVEHRSEGIELYYKGELWFETGRKLQEWTGQLKSLMQKKSPYASLILGGVKSQFAHWRPEFYQNFDHVFLGAADHSIITLAEELKSGKPSERFIKQNNSLKNQGLCPVTMHPSINAIQPNESLPVEISRGCLYDCKFCHYEKKQSQRKDLKLLKEELINNYEKFGTSVYHFCDDCFNDTRKKVEDTCNMFLQLPFKLEWVAYARPDVAVKFNETVDLMLESGARGLYWGIESFDFEAARGAGKGTDPELIKDFFHRYQPKFRGRCITEGS